MDAYANIISNNTNNTMKFLAVLTIVMSIPTMIASFAGMNLDGIPLSGNAYGFWIMVAVGIGIAAIVAVIMKIKDMF
jgi:magnesium transporter